MMNKTVLVVIIGLVSMFVAADCKRILVNGVSVNETKIIIALHNDIRLQIQRGKVLNQPRSANMQELCWDSTLAAKAQEVANSMIFEHQIKRDDRWVVGQNLAETTSMGPYINDKADWQRAINRWFSEVHRYSYGFNIIKGTGHYTQVVWAETTHVGCGYTYFIDYNKMMKYRKLYVCNYGPTGNVVGESPYTTGGCGCKGLCKTDCHASRKKLEYYDTVEENENYDNYY